MHPPSAEVLLLLQPAFGNIISVLGGNFVLGWASATLSQLGDSEVTEFIASVLPNLVVDEILDKSKTTSKPPTPFISDNRPRGKWLSLKNQQKDSQLLPVRSVDHSPLLAPSPSRDSSRHHRLMILRWHHVLNLGYFPLPTQRLHQKQSQI